jgi:hypothetical protein
MKAWRGKRGAWRSKFLSVLARTANARLSAESAGVDHTTAYQLRDRDPGFAAAWVRARAWGRARVKAEGRAVHACGRPRGSGRGPPEDARALIVRRSKREGAQIVRAGEGRWSPAIEEDFFAWLVAGFGVRHSARAVGFSTVALYKRRAREPAFAARWDLAREEGKVRNDGLLIDAVPLALDPEVIEAAEDLPRPTIAEAIRIVGLYRREGRSGRRGRSHGPPEPRIEEVRDEVLRRLRAIRAHRAEREGESDGSGQDRG